MPRGKSAPVQERAWQRMLSGRRLDILDPSPMDIEIEDIAHGLARVARWNGQTYGDHAFSVAQHSVVVLDLCLELRARVSHECALAALLHDAPEYVVGDLISPFKAAVGTSYKALEERLQSAIHIRFGLPGTLPETTKALIKKADRICAYFEAVRLAGFSQDEAARFFGAPRGVAEPDVTPLPIRQAQTLFLERFEAAYEALQSARTRGRQRA